MTIQGSLLLLGDSMTVGLDPYVPTAGKKLTIAQGSKTTDWLRNEIALVGANRGGFGDFSIAHVLIGANDIGGGRNIDDVFRDLKEVVRIADMSSENMKVFVSTLPPFRGWANYAPRYDAIEARRRDLNQRIRNSFPDSRVIPLDVLLADPNDPSRLSPAFDSGDHLHPNKMALGHLLDQQIEKKQLESSGGSSFPWTIAVLGAAGLGLWWWTKTHK
jgi:hypothetical protein